MLHSKIVTLTLTALTIVSLAAPAGAAPKPRVDLRGDGVGSYALDDAGTAHLAGAVTGTPFDGPYTATLAADDGTLPSPGDCEAATATLHAVGPRKKYPSSPGPARSAAGGRTPPPSSPTASPAATS